MNLNAKQIVELKAERQLCSARFSPDAKRAFGGGYDCRVYGWDFSGEKPAATPAWDNGGGWVQDVVFHPKQPQVFVADSWGRLRCWDYSGKQPRSVWLIEQAHDGWIYGLAIDAKGEHLATGGVDGKVRLWSTRDGSKQREFAGHDHAVLSVQFHPTEPSLVSGDHRGLIRQWQFSSEKPVRSFDASSLYKEHRLQSVGGVRVLRFDPTGKLLLAAGTVPKNGGNVQGVPTVIAFDFNTGKPTKTISLGKTSDVYVTDLAFHPAGFLAATTSGNPGAGKLLFFKLDDGKPFFETTKMRNCHSLSLAPDGKRMLVTSTNNGSNGNGRRLVKGEYVGNYSPVHVLDVVEGKSK